MTKKVKIIAASVACVVAGFAALTLYIGNKEHQRYVKAHENDKPDYRSSEGMKELLNETFPSDVMIYGEDVDFMDIVSPRKLSSLSKESILAEKDLDHRFLVIVNRENTLDLSVDELKELKDVIMNKDNGISIYYIGSEGRDKFVEAGLVEKIYYKDDCGIGSECIGYEDYNYRTYSDGFWTAKDEELYREALNEVEYGFSTPDNIGNGKHALAESLLREFVDVVRTYDKSNQISDDNVDCGYRAIDEETMPYEYDNDYEF